jgi:hypothetical protein
MAFLHNLGRFLPVANERKLTSSDIACQMQSRLRQLTPIAIYNVNDSKLVVVWLIVDQRRCARLLPLI